MGGTIPFIDKNTIDLASIVLGGIGILKIFIEFSSQHLHSTFLDFNPYSIKKEYLEKYPNKLFDWLPFLALLFQALEAIFSDRIPERIYSTMFYISLFLSISFVGILSLIIALQLGKRSFRHQIVPLQKEAYLSVIDIVKNDGWRSDQLQDRDRLQDPERYQKANWETAEERLGQIEELLEINSKGRNLSERVKALEKYF
ncbi:MAG TPA: hypothetical protein VFX30_03225 [bacterium]|nr:hypothetical protein [bacterium]